MTQSAVDIARVLSRFAGVPVWVAAGECDIVDSPYGEERQLVARAVPGRRAEFFSGRYYARQLLRQLGRADTVILRGEKGDPLWPEGILGSISHDLGQIVVAVMEEVSYSGLGIDLVVDPARIEPSLQALIATPADLEILGRHCPGYASLALAFSFKEAVVKAISPLIDCYLDFMDIELGWDNGQIFAYIAQFKCYFRCDFVALTQGLLTFALMDKR
ncbi:MAG TPA: 4'-phosphopantetheinyl transferase superfamily protein [Cellvibrio sp.]|nr:4'-phosphopantetheinyl transferase superfamily protein [Cellvibrio sp.]